MSHRMADKDVGNPDQGYALLTHINGSVGRFIAYDGELVCDAVKRRSPDSPPKVVVPSRKTVVLSSWIEEGQADRDRHILDLEVSGRMAWQKVHHYGRRSLMGTTTLSRLNERLASRFSAE